MYQYLTVEEWLVRVEGGPSGSPGLSSVRIILMLELRGPTLTHPAHPQQHSPLRPVMESRRQLTQTVTSPSLRSASDLCQLAFLQGLAVHPEELSKREQDGAVYWAGVRSVGGVLAERCQHLHVEKEQV